MMAILSGGARWLRLLRPSGVLVQPPGPHTRPHGHTPAPEFLRGCARQGQSRLGQVQHVERWRDQSKRQHTRRECRRLGPSTAACARERGDGHRFNKPGCRTHASALNARRARFRTGERNQRPASVAVSDACNRPLLASTWPPSTLKAEPSVAEMAPPASVTMSEPAAMSHALTWCSQ